MYGRNFLYRRPTKVNVDAFNSWVKLKGEGGVEGVGGAGGGGAGGERRDGSTKNKGTLY